MDLKILELMRNPKINFIRMDKVYVHPVPTNKEIKTLIEGFPLFHPYQLSIAMISIQALRPIENADLRWSEFLKDDKGEYENLRYSTYKAKNEKSFSGNTGITGKILQKEIYSDWLKNYLKIYKKVAPKYFYGKLFPFTTSDSIRKYLVNSRKKAKKTGKNKFLLETRKETLLGRVVTRYRIEQYSFRKFAFTFHYYITYDKDIVSLSKDFGHKNVETTFKHYIFPFKSIGLTKKMIQDKISIDEFLNLKPIPKAIQKII